MKMSQFPTHHQLLDAIQEQAKKSPLSLTQSGGCRSDIGEDQDSDSEVILNLKANAESIYLLARVEWGYTPAELDDDDEPREDAPAQTYLRVWVGPISQPAPNSNSSPTFSRGWESYHPSLADLADMIIKPIIAAAIQAKGDRSWVTFQINPIVGLIDSKRKAKAISDIFGDIHTTSPAYGMRREDVRALVLPEEVETLKVKIQALEDEAAKVLGFARTPEEVTP